jgi:hypothetical protein
MDLSFGVRFQLSDEKCKRTFGTKSIDIVYATAPVKSVIVAPTPADPPTTFSLAEALAMIACLVGTVFSEGEDAIDELVDLLTSMKGTPWGAVIDADVTPSLTISDTEGSIGLSLSLTLAKALTVGGSSGSGGLSITFEPDVTIYAILIDWQQGKGAKLRASVTFPDQKGGSGKAKPEVVAFPFPIPPSSPAPKFRVNLFAIGQHFAPQPSSYINTADPISTALTKMEDVFTSDSPDQLLLALANYYDASVGWFVAADILLYGWKIKVLFADPGTYGVEISYSGDNLALQGFLFEILYTKISPGLGVYYGELTLPAAARQIGIQGGQIDLPSFALWIYTNGDFRVEVGWPLGVNSISIQFEGFTGSAGFYFAKMRSADVPAVKGAPDYNPVIEFGLAVSLGIGGGYNKGVISATISVTIAGTVQGLLAWESEHAGKSLWNPDHYWFAGSVSLTGIVQGSVDLAIISASISIVLTATVAIAFETGYATELDVTASVRVEVSVHVAFFTIHIHFSATVSTSFALGGSGAAASMTGPQGTGLQGFLPPTSGTTGDVAAPVAIRRGAARPEQRRLAAAAPLGVQVYFALQPALVSSTGAVANAVATLAIPKPPDANASGDPSFTNLVTALTAFLQGTYGSDWITVSAALGAPSDPPPPGFATGLRGYLASNVKFTLTGVDYGGSPVSQSNIVLFPMFDVLQMTVAGVKAAVTFSSFDTTGTNYPPAIAAYFQQLAAYAAHSSDGPPPVPSTPESIARLIFDDYFLLLARTLAQDLAKVEQDLIKSGQLSTHGPIAPDAALVLTLAGLGSRMLLHGTRLPDPRTIGGSTGPFAEKDLSGLYLMSGQQFAPGQGAKAAQATLAVPAGSTDPLAGAIAFATGSGATANLPIPATLPPLPAPQWLPQPPNQPPTTSTLAFSALPGVVAAPTLFAAPNGRKLTVAGNSSVLLYLPSAAVTQVTAPGAPAWTVSAWADSKKSTALTPTLGLLVPVVVAQIPSANASGTAASSKAPTTLPHVYEVLGTDDPTRDLIDLALATAGAISTTTAVQLLFSDGSGNFAADPAPVSLIAKTNLSTDADPGTSPFPFLMAVRAATTEDLGPCSASLADGADLLRLVWEASVVHTSGYYLYYDDGSGKGLDPGLFKGGRANLWLWVPAGGTTAAPYWNAFSVVPAASVNGTVFVGLGTSKTQALSYQPNYAPGTVAFELDWYAAPIAGGGTTQSAFDPAVIDALYHLVSYEVTVAGNAAPLWTLPLSPQDAPAETNDFYAYRSVIPATSLITGNAAPSPYAAVGQSIEIAFRLADVYGDVLASGLSGLPLTIAYNDPLIPPTSWPSFQLLYRFLMSGQTASLDIGLWFNPAPGMPSKTQTALLTFYTALGNQLSDSRVTASLTCSLLGTTNLDAQSTLLAKLGSVVSQIVTGLKGANPQQILESMTLAVTPTQAQIPASSIVPVSVAFMLARPPGLVDPTALKFLPSAQTVTCDLFPDIAGRINGASGATLNAFAQDFEKVFNPVDGSGGVLKLAVQCLNQSAAADQDDHLWAVHLGGSGLGVSATPITPDRPARCYTMEPFSLTLAYSDTPLPVTTYGSFSPSTGTFPAQPTNIHVAGLDVDALVNDFLLAIDRILAPDITTYLAHADAADYQTLLGYKWDIADQLLSRRLIPVLESAHGNKIPPPAKSTIEAFKQSLLVALGNAYTVAAVVEFDMAVKTPDPSPPGATTPQFFGPFNLPKADTSHPYALSSGRLPITAGAQTVAMLASVPNAEAAAHFQVDLTYDIGFIQFNFEATETDFGYTPSSWLRFILPASALDIPLGKVDIPVPLRRYPSLPVIQSQTATGGGSAAPSGESITQQIENVLVWPYTLNVNKVDPAPQDEMTLVLTLNGGLIDQQLHSDADNGLTPRVVALLQFQAAYMSLLPALQTAANNTLAENQALLQILVPLVGTVVNPPSKFAAAAFAPAPAEKRTYTMKFDNYFGDIRTLTLRADYPAASVTPSQALAAMPTIAIDKAPGVSATKAQRVTNEWQVTYSFPATLSPATAFAITWPGFHLLQYQTAITTAQVIRNADIEVDPLDVVNSKLIYHTPVVSPPQAIVPLVVVSPPPLTQAARFDTAAAALGAVFDALLAMILPLSVTVRVDYCFPLASPISTSANKDPVMTRVAAVLATGVPINSASDIGPFVSALAADVVSWANLTGPWPTSNAALALNVALFASISEAGEQTELPLLKIAEIDLPLADNWLPK